MILSREEVDSLVDRSASGFLDLGPTLAARLAQTAQELYQRPDPAAEPEPEE